MPYLLLFYDHSWFQIKRVTFWKVHTTYFILKLVLSWKFGILTNYQIFQNCSLDFIKFFIYHPVFKNFGAIFLKKSPLLIIRVIEQDPFVLLSIGYSSIQTSYLLYFICAYHVHSFCAVLSIWKGQGRCQGQFSIS